MYWQSFTSIGTSFEEGTNFRSSMMRIRWHGRSVPKSWFVFPCPASEAARYKQPAFMCENFIGGHIFLAPFIVRSGPALKSQYVCEMQAGYVCHISNLVKHKHVCCIWEPTKCVCIRWDLKMMSRLIDKCLLYSHRVGPPGQDHLGRWPVKHMLLHITRSPSIMGIRGEGALARRQRLA